MILKCPLKASIDGWRCEFTAEDAGDKITLYILSLLEK